MRCKDAPNRQRERKSPLAERSEVRLADLAEVQHGVFSREQAAACGVTRWTIQRRVSTARWDRLRPGVFRIAGTPASWRQSLLAACFAWGKGSAASHRAAAALARLPAFGRPVVELTAPRGRKRAAVEGVVVHRVASLPAVDVTSVDAIPVTTVARTLVDLASVAPRDALEEALDDALRRGLVSLARLRWRVSELGRRGRPGMAAIRALLAERGHSPAVPQSVFETRLLRLLVRSGLPQLELQYRVRDGGRVVAVVDFAYPDCRVAIEAEGYRWHSGKAQWERDLARRDRLTMRGWRILHVTWGSSSSTRRTSFAAFGGPLRKRARLQKGLERQL